MSFKDLVLYPVLNSISRFKERNAFYINGTFYTYNDLGKCISKIRSAIRNIPENNIALVANDDLETYASIWALWLEGKCYVPLHPEQPLERCQDIINQVDMHYILDSSDETRYNSGIVIMSQSLIYKGDDLEYEDKYSDENLAYILFTSGSTGKPKGVTLCRRNIAGFIEAFWALGYELDENDHCLQMFDLTFDLSVQSYIVPLLVGACAYTVPPTKLKYGAIFELIDEHALTFALMVPSIIHYLRPYMDEINAPSMKYSLFCGEALPLDETEDWSKSLPNARIDNVYGPTENTIYCTACTYNRNGTNKESNGVMSIGKAMEGTQTIIIDENRNIVPVGEKGELCLAGVQLTPGYWQNPEKNAEAFFEKDGTRFYRTGDLCAMDADGDILYHGRIDFQVKIQGYRIELGEIEHHAREFLAGANAVAVAFTNQAGSAEIALCIEDDKKDSASLLNYLKSKIPGYMIPSIIVYEPQFPLNVNGKIDRKALTKLAENNQ